MCGVSAALQKQKKRILNATMLGSNLSLGNIELFGGDTFMMSENCHFVVCWYTGNVRK